VISILLKIPKFKTIDVKNIVFDFNGTIATSGEVSEKIVKKIMQLTQQFNVYIVTADTFGTVQERFNKTDIEVYIIDQETGTVAKAKFIQKIGAEQTIALGNGNNDCQMLEKSAIGISVLGAEGLSVKTLKSSDLLINDVLDFFEMIEQPKKLIASLRQ
jgi:soluble P-type ATPase